MLFNFCCCFKGWPAISCFEGTKKSFVQGLNFVAGVLGNGDHVNSEFPGFVDHFYSGVAPMIVKDEQC